MFILTITVRKRGTFENVGVITWVDAEKPYYLFYSTISRNKTRLQYGTMLHAVYYYECCRQLQSVEFTHPNINLEFLYLTGLVPNCEVSINWLKI